MEVILLEKIGKLGGIGDRANVKAGFGRNYLIPQGKAVFATEANSAAFELRRAELEANAADKLVRADAMFTQCLRNVYATFTERLRNLYVRLRIV